MHVGGTQDSLAHSGDQNRHRTEVHGEIRTEVQNVALEIERVEKSLPVVGMLALKLMQNRAKRKYKASAHFAACNSVLVYPLLAQRHKMPQYWPWVADLLRPFLQVGSGGGPLLKLLWYDLRRWRLVVSQMTSFMSRWTCWPW